MPELAIWLEPCDAPVGRLVSDDFYALTFTYKPAYLRRPDATALSLSMPLTAEPYGDAAARAWFANLLQEGKRLDDICAGGPGRLPVDRNDVVGLLEQLGRECPGAVSAVPPGAPPGKRPGVLATDYAPIPDEELAAELANLFAGRPAKPGTEFSLAGVQSKMAVTVAADGTLLEPLPGSGAPTTHVLKVGDADHEALVENEFLCLELAAALGLPVVAREMRERAGVRSLLVPRYDRAVDYGNGTVHRLHQEDCCQALGLPPSLKYEKRGDRATGRIADFARLFGLNAKTAVPADFRATIAKANFLNFLIGNADAHAKNFSLLHDGRRPRLAPLYDLICIALYPRHSQEFSMRIGGSVDGAVAGKKMWDDIEREDWLAFLAIAGFRGAGGARFLETQLKPMADRALAAFDDLVVQHGLQQSPACAIRDCLAKRLAHLRATLGW
ncbi:MAG: type II toxin-antitoxin system HipA family toxin [Caulobacter sp.]|nr:type II toxin-antitoxin system HipA family toxin [Caulobacter sp.]